MSIDLKILEYDESNYRMGTLCRFCAEECDNKEAFKLGKKMVALMEEAGGIGLAANQVGHLIQLIVVKIGNKPTILYRPTILSFGQEYDVAEEGCLSLPGIRREIKRPTSVRFSAIVSKAGKRKEFTLRGLEARCFQHEIEHLQGITILDERK